MFGLICTKTYVAITDVSMCGASIYLLLQTIFSIFCYWNKFSYLGTFFVCYNISILCLDFGSSNNLTGWCLKIKCLKHKVLFGITASCYWRMAVSNVVSDICLFGGEGYSFKLPIYLSWFFAQLSVCSIFFMLEFWLWTDFYVIARYFSLNETVFSTFVEYAGI